MRNWIWSRKPSKKSQMYSQTDDLTEVVKNKEVTNISIYIAYRIIKLQPNLT